MAFKYNIVRYGEFLDMATDHLDDLQSQLGRFATSLSNEAIESCKIIERQLKWALRRLRSQPKQPQIDRRLFRTMRTLSEDIHSFCLRSTCDRYQAEMSCVQEVISEVMPEIKNRVSDFNLDELWQIRLSIQSEVLKKCPVAKKQLGSIANDAVYDLSFYYFLIDYYLLPQIIK